jgi:hypothetical protein
MSIYNGEKPAVFGLSMYTDSVTQPCMFRGGFQPG